MITVAMIVTFDIVIVSFRIAQTAPRALSLCCAYQ
jgi:hypothetical protein